MTAIGNILQLRKEVRQLEENASSLALFAPSAGEADAYDHLAMELHDIDTALFNAVFIKNDSKIEKLIESIQGVAEDAQQKFFRLGKPAIAYSDPHIQHAAAALLDENALVIAISHSGRSSDILKTVEIARETRAKVISITATKSPLAQSSDVALTVDVNEDSDIFSPVKSRLGQMVVLDILAVGVAVRGGDEMLQQLARARRAIDFKFVKG